MRRRDFITLMAAAAGFPFAARAQEKGRIYRLGVYARDGRNTPYYAALIDELRRHGFVEGQNLVIEARGYRLPREQFVQLATELVEARPDVIVTGGDIAIRAAQHATKTIPILAMADDMIGAGLVRSLANPDGNTTGVSLLATELDGKRQELLLEAIPGVRRMAALADVNTTSPPQLQRLQEAARARGVDLLIYQVAKPD
jgi:putative ABC transport system substrate-binding protein